MDDDNDRFNSYCDSDTDDISIECKSIKLKVYEETVNNLVEENKKLRQQLNRVTDDARQQEEKLINTLNEATNDLKKNDEMNQNKYRAQLQSYYECFVELEKENDILKLRVQQLCEKLKNVNINDESQDLPKNSSDDFTRPISPSMVSQKDDEIKELKNELEKLTSEVEMFKSMKIYMEESKVKRKSSVEKAKLETKLSNDSLINVLNENLSHLEIEKNSLENKLSSIEASLTRWIFRACDYKTDLQQAQTERDELKTENEKLSKSINELNARLSKIEENETFKEENGKLNLKIAELINQCEELKKADKTKTESQTKLRSQLDQANYQLISLKETIKANEIEIKKLEGDICDLKTTNVDLQRKEYEFKTQLEQNKTEITDMNELRRQNEQFKSEITYLLKKNDGLTNENQQNKKKLDACVLEKNSIKHKYDEILSDYEKLNVLKKQEPEKSHSFVQTEPIIIQNVTHDDQLKKLAHKYDKQMHEYRLNELNLKNDVEQLKLKLVKIEQNYDDLNKTLDYEYKLNCEMRERNDFLFNKCEKLKNELDSQINEFNKYKTDIDVEKEIYETTIGQQKKFIDFITNTEPELIKRLKLLAKK